MRIVIDMQGAQTESRYRGIGRYTLSFAQAIVRNRDEHEVILALSGLLSDTIEPIRAAFDGLLPQENIRVWRSPGPVKEEQLGNDNRRELAEIVREAFLASLVPDVIHISSLFEGYVDDAVTSIGRFDPATAVSVSLYDLIPLLNPDHYLKPKPRYAQHYMRKVGYLRQAAIYLAISEFTRQEGLEKLNISESAVINVSTAIEPSFQPLPLNDSDTARLRQKIGIAGPFVLYTGGGDERKNLPRLINAFAGLPAALRDSHQLLLAGQIHNVPKLMKHAKSSGMQVNKLCFTGYIKNEELIQLYNLCKLFIFPSWHEGFGLPALEAMACGAPVIGSNTSSLPEVIALDEALFDPGDVGAITTKMAQALQDDAFRARLCENGLKQAKKFSWDESAKRALAAWERLNLRHHRTNAYIDCSLSRQKMLGMLAAHIADADSSLLIPLAESISQNQSAGIERQLFLDISELVQRDAATGVQRVVRSYLKALLRHPPSGFRVEPVFATREEGYRYARSFTQHFLGKGTAHLINDPMQWQRGDIFLGLDMQHHVQLAHKGFYRQLWLDGVTVKFLVYDLLPIQLENFFNDLNAKDLHEAWLAMIASTDGAICISKATADAFDKWIAENNINRAPSFHLTWVHIGGDIDSSNPSHGMPSDAPKLLKKLCSRPSFLCVATLEPRKGQQQVVDAIQLMWDEGVDVNLVLVGHEGWDMKPLTKKIINHPEKDQRLFWLKGISDEYLEQVYSASTCLIAASINEGFGLPMVEAARYKIPIVARDIPVFREVAGEHAFYFSGETPCDLATALKAWLDLHQKRCYPDSSQMQWLTWRESAEKLKRALVQENYPRRQLLVDVSELVQHDAKSGIQRVVRSLLKEWLDHPPIGYRVELVYATIDRGYRYAHSFTQSFLGYSDGDLKDESIEYEAGDVFLGLDMNHHMPRVHDSYLETMNREGVRIIFVIYDLLPIQFPHFWETQHSVHLVHQQWLNVITKFDGAVCISKTVAEELSQWLKKNGPKRHRPFKIDWFHLGADVNNSVPTKGLPDDADTLLDRLSNRYSFLMVGTLEPRKSHDQVLGAFELLWQLDQDFNLVIVGKQGWLVENLVERLRSHPELNKRFFWLEGISDEYLEKVYAASTCLIVASYGEGFGLPLIEAAQYNLPIIARDIPVFREVAGEHAYYFDTKSPDALAEKIRAWLALYNSDQHPKSNKIPWLTWSESARQLCKVVLNNNIHQQSPTI